MTNFSLAQVRKDPVREWLDTLSEFTYEKFVECVNRCIDEIARDLEDNNKDRISDSEDRTTEEIKTNLRRKNLFDGVEHDAQTGGHTDLVVRLGAYTWKSEAKIFGGKNHANYTNKWLKKGFDALTQKYSKGSEYDSAGSLLIYVKKPKTSLIMKTWGEYLDTNTDFDIELTPCCQSKLAFVTIHEHINSGLPYQVRHVPICLYDATKPPDKH